MVPAWTSSSQVAWWTGRSHRFPEGHPHGALLRRGQAGLGEVQAQLDDPLVQSRVGVPQVLEHLEVEGTQVVKAVHLDPDSLHVPQPGGEGLLHRAAVADLDLIPRYDLRLTGVLIGHGEVPQGEGIDVVLPAVCSGQDQLVVLDIHHPAGGHRRPRQGASWCQPLPLGLSVQAASRSSDARHSMVPMVFMGKPSFGLSRPRRAREGSLPLLDGGRRKKKFPAEAKSGPCRVVVRILILLPAHGEPMPPAGRGVFHRAG